MASPRPLDDALREAILASPDDDAPRMVLADRLMQQGDPRGRFIAVQCALARKPHDREALLAEEAALLGAHARSWLAPLGLKRAEVTFRRGMIEVVRLNIRRIRALAGVIREPVRALHLTGALTPTDTRALIQIPTLRELHLKNSAGVGIGDDGLSELLHRGLLDGIDSLSLAHNGVTDVGAERLAASEDSRSLAVLELQGNTLTARGMRAFARSAPLSGLQQLALYGNTLGPSGASAMCDGDSLRKLVRLSVSYTGIRSEGLLAIASALTELRWLGAGSVATNEAAMHAIAALPKLEQLDLYQSNVSDAVVSVLAASPRATALRVLRLASNPISDLGASALASSPYLRGLSELDLKGNPIGREARSHLVARFAGALSI